MRIKGRGGGRECRMAFPVEFCSVCFPGLTLENALCLTPILCFHCPKIVGDFVWDFFFLKQVFVLPMLAYSSLCSQG